jgi:hypothetical protein
MIFATMLSFASTVRRCISAIATCNPKIHLPSSCGQRTAAETANWCKSTGCAHQGEDAHGLHLARGLTERAGAKLGVGEKMR